MVEMSKATEWIVLVILLLIGISLVPTVVSTIAETNQTDAFWNFTGGTAARTLFNLLPFIFVVGLVIYFLIRLLSG